MDGLYPQGFFAFGAVKIQSYKKSGIHIQIFITIKTWIKSHENANEFAKGILAKSAFLNSSN